MKGVISTISSNVNIIDITHDIIPQDVREGAFVLMTTAPYFPMGTVHVAVVDPGVGTYRKGIIIATRSQILIGPDNGLLIPTAQFLGDFMVYEITKTKYMRNNVSNTFHGRDVFAPSAAYILNGVPFEEIGHITNDFVNLNFGVGEITNNSALGKVIHIDTFGNLITNISGIKLRNVLNYDKKIIGFIGNNKQIEIMFVKSYDFVKKGQILATIGSSNFLEIGVNQGDASKKLKIKPDDPIKILFS
jgi:S-adenosylmethionine hydrolase